MKISDGKIRLENKVIDLSTFQIRPKITEQDLERNYDSFIGHIQEIGDYFEDTPAFDRVVNDAAHDKRPKLIARETKYPFMWAFRDSFTPFGFLKPSTRRLHDDYFIVAHCMVKISSKKKTLEVEIEGERGGECEGEDESEKSLDEKLQDDISEKFKQYPNYEGIIEIPNDGTQSETKSTTFHESLHYIILRYHAETERNFVNAFIKEDLSPLEKYQAENILHEHAVEILTDKLLVHYPDAQFENRWTHYSLNNGFKHLAMGASAITTGVLIGAFIFNNPYLFPLVFVPGRIRDYAVEKYKKSKQEEILKPIEYPKFKI